MANTKSLVVLTMIGLLTLGGTAAADAKKNASAKGKSPAVESEEVVKQKLDDTGKKLVANASVHIVPNIKKKEVSKQGSDFVAKYFEADPSTLSTELRRSETGKGYVGIVRYVERTMECRGNSRDAALKAPCVNVKSRRMSELLHYDGKWAF